MYDGIFLFGGDFQKISCMDTHKSILTVVKIVVPFAEIKIEDADGIDFLYFGIEIAQFYMFLHRMKPAAGIRIRIMKICGFYLPRWQ